MRTSKFTETPIIAVLKPAEGGTPGPDPCRGISWTTFYKRPSKFGSMDASPMFRLKGL